MAPLCMYSNVETRDDKKMDDKASENVRTCLRVAASFTYN